MQPDTPANLDLNYLVPTVTSDGNSIFISNDGDIPTITFFQVRRQDGQTIFSDAVASVRMNSLDDLRNLQRSIGEAIDGHTSREK
jgi:hypothetical protein